MSNPISRQPYENSYATNPEPSDPESQIDGRDSDDALSESYSLDDSMEDGDYLQQDSYSDGEMDMGGEGQDFSGQALRKRLTTLKATVEGGGIEDEEKNKILHEIVSLQGQINHLMSLPADQRDAGLQALNEKIGEVENKAFSEQGEVEGAGGDTESEYTLDQLKDKAKAIGDKIDSLYSKGMITEDLHDHLKNDKFSRFEALLSDSDPDLNFIGQQFDDLDGSLDLLKQQYVINGEPIDQMEGDEGPKGPEVLGKLKELLGAKVKDKDILATIQKHYPELDKSGDGDLSAKELQDAIDDKSWPPVTGPDQKMLEFLYDIDKKDLGAQFDGAQANGWEGWKSASNRIVSLLKALYPDKADTIKVPDWSADARSWCNIWFDGRLFSFANKSVDGLVDRDRCNMNLPANSLCYTAWSETGEGWRPVDAPTGGTQAVIDHFNNW